MNRRLLTISVLIIAFACIFAVSTPLFAFEWSEKGITVQDRASIEQGTRITLVDSSQKSFSVIHGKDLFTDSVKEVVYNVFTQISDSYNLPTSSIEFEIKPELFEIRLVLDQTAQTIAIVNHGLKPSENLIPTVSVMINEFTAWKDLTIASLQVIAKGNSFQTVITPTQGSPLINLQFASAQPQKKIISDLAIFYNEVSNWQGLDVQEFNVAVGKAKINATINGLDGRGIELTYHGSQLNPKQLKNIGTSYNTVAGWKSIGPKRVLISAKPEEINTVVTLSKAVYRGKDLLKFLPSGIRLIFDNELSYNFRTVTGQYFVQIIGDYTSESKLLWQINEAIKNPILYIRKYDPEFFFRQLEGIRNQNAEIFNELRAKNELLTKNYNNLREAHEKFIFGYISMENSGFMRRADDNKAAINRIVELKTSNPEFTRNQIETQLDSEEIDVTNKVIDMVLNLYFNDFKK